MVPRIAMTHENHPLTDDGVKALIDFNRAKAKFTQEHCGRRVDNAVMPTPP